MFRKIYIYALSITILTFGSGNVSFGQDMYKVSLVRAAPGDLLELIEVFKDKAEDLQKENGNMPLILRHSQGDSWDLMVIQFIGDYASYFGTQSGLKTHFVPPYGAIGSDLIAYHEEMFFTGPDLNSLNEQIGTNNYYHVEMFIALSGNQEELLSQRNMENKYLEYLDRPLNFIFTRDMGGRWDLFTLGVYRDLPHYAESALIPEEKEEKAAVQAGFKSVGTIGSYLRSLILEHHDTLATKVN